MPPSHYNLNLTFASRRSPSTGVFYLVPTPRRWLLFAWRHDEYPLEMDHAYFWKTELCASIANLWVTAPAPVGLRRACTTLAAALRPYSSAFPRGRVALSGADHVVHWGENFPPGTMGLRLAVVRYFGLSSSSPWRFDAHEQALAHDYRRVRSILPISAVWPVV